MRLSIIFSFILIFIMIIIYGYTNHNSNISFYDPRVPITVNSGSRFVIILDSNPTTGYSWQLGKPLDDKMLKYVNRWYKAPKNGLIGQGGQEYWSFEAIKSGNTSIIMKYARPWEAESIKSDIYIINIK